MVQPPSENEFKNWKVLFLPLSLIKEWPQIGEVQIWFKHLWVIADNRKLGAAKARQKQKEESRRHKHRWIIVVFAKIHTYVRTMK